MRRVLFVLLLAAVPACAESIVVTTEVCGEEPPETRYGLPLCSEYELHDALIQLVEAGDSSALRFLEDRYDRTDTYVERHRLAEVLLRRSSRGAAIWEEIFTDAKLAVRFAAVGGELPEEYVQWCEERDFDEYEHSLVHDRALAIASSDPRSRDLLVQALGAEEKNVVYIAFAGLAQQRDAGSLPALEKTIERFPDDAEALASVLGQFESDAAKAIMKKYIHEEAETAADEEEEEDQIDPGPMRPGL